MSDRYCVYNGKKYKIKKKNDKYIITSRVRKEDFINYIDVLGNEHSELFMKIVNANEVDIIYNEDILIKYKDKYFHLLNWNPSFQFASLSSDLANRLHK